MRRPCARAGHFFRALLGTYLGPLGTAAAGWAACVALLSLCALRSPSGADAEEPALKKVDGLYAQGQFDTARVQYEVVLARTPNDPHVIERLGFIHFFKGEYPRAIERFQEVIRLHPPRRRLMLAYTAFAHYHLRHYSQVVEIMGEVGNLNLLNAEQLRLLAAEAPYRIESKTRTATIPFLQVDPLPVIRIRVNSRPIDVLIDTGAAQLVLDPEFAREAGIGPVSRQGVAGAAGGKTAAVAYGMAGSVSLGRVSLRNVPVWILPTRGFSEGFGSTIQGILGTEILRQFLPTLDFPGKQLVLRPRGTALRRTPRTLVPFLIDGIHYLYAPCVLNDGEPVLMNFDSGLADDQGAALDLSGAALGELGIPKPDLTHHGLGGGGAFTYGYADVDSVRVGDLVQRKIRATYTGREGHLVSPAGYKHYGLVSHNFLKHYRWTIDFDKRVFLFEG